MILSLDTETTGLDSFHGCRPFMATGCTGKHNYLWQGKVDPFSRKVTWEPDTIQRINNIVAEADTIVFHNTNFDVRMLKSIGVNVPWSKIEDTLVASHVLCSGDVHGLKPLAVKYLRYHSDDEKDLQEAVVRSREQNQHLDIARLGHPFFPGAKKNTKWWAMDMWLEPELCARYAIRDAERTWLLWKAFKAGIIQDGLWEQYCFRRDLLPILYDMQTTGIHFYKDKAIEYEQHLEYQQEELRKLIQKAAGTTRYIEPSKSKDLAFLLFKVLKLPVTKLTEKGRPATDSKTLDKLLTEYKEIETIAHLRNWKVVTKKRTAVRSLIKWCDDNNRLHSSLNLTGTHWTRQSSSDPNQQNFDKQMTFLFGPEKHNYWLYVDVVNIELRIWAYETCSKELIDKFERGISVHMIIAEALYPEMIAELGEAAFKETKTYTNCKSGTFARMYGGGVFKVEQTYGVANACAIIDAKLPEIGQYFKQLNFQMEANRKKYGYPCIFTRQGYRLDVPITKPYSVPSGRIQGTAGLIVQQMMYDIVVNKTYLTRGIKLIQQVHDSLTFEIPQHKEYETTNSDIIKALEGSGRITIPTCPMDGKVIWPDYSRPELLDYKHTNTKFGDYRCTVFRQFDEVENDYVWRCRVRSSKDKTFNRVFTKKWKPEVIQFTKEELTRLG